MLLFLPHPVLYNLANRDNSRGLAEGCHHPLMEEERLKKRLIQLPGNNPTVSPWQTVFNGPAERFRNIIRKMRQPEQAGFMSDRSTIEQIFTIRQIVKKTTEFRQKAFIAFVDFHAAFDSVDRETLWRILEFTGLAR